MRLQFGKQTMQTMLLLCAALTVGAMALLLNLYGRGEGEKGRLLGERDEWTVLSGAPVLSGSPVTVPREKLLQGTLLLVSREHPLPQDYPAPSTRTVRAMVGAYLPSQDTTALRQEMIYALCCAQLDHALEEGVILTQGAVSFGQQQERQRLAFSRYAQVYSLSDALRQASAAIPGGGESEHQTGLAVDVALTPPLSMGEENPLRRNSEGQWLWENMWRYGLIQRYAPGDGAEGGCEEIHLRYVGVVHASAMRALGMSLESYLSLLRNERAVTVLRDQQPWAYLYCDPCDAGAAFPLPEGAAWEISADNTGWVILAVAAGQGFAL